MSIVVNEKKLGQAIVDAAWEKLKPELDDLKAGRLAVIGTFGGVGVNAVFELEKKKTDEARG